VRKTNGKKSLVNYCVDAVNDYEALTVLDITKINRYKKKVIRNFFDSDGALFVADEEQIRELLKELDLS
jgi:hypothetical protein